MRIDLSQLDFIDPKLREMVTETESALGIEFTVTSLYRPGDPGVHGTIPVRGLDTSCRDKAVGDAIAAYVNARWIYDDTRPQFVCCMAHGRTLHLHWQVHPRTRRARR